MSGYDAKSETTVEVIQMVQCRRWTAGEKIRMIEESMLPGMNVSFVARRHGVNPNLLFRWRKLMTDGGKTAVNAGGEVVSASEVHALKKQIRELERLLGKKTMEVEILREAVEIAHEKKLICSSLDLMLQCVEIRFNSLQAPNPIEWLSDNGSCYTAKDTRDFAAQLNLVSRFTPVRSPESNGLSEAFVKTFKRDYVFTHFRPNAISTINQLAEWFNGYNEMAPHKALRMLSPREFIRSTETATCPV